MAEPIREESAVMRDIQVDDEVFSRLQGLAEPFVDTPNSVLRRMLGLEVDGAMQVLAKQTADGRGGPPPGEDEDTMTNSAGAMTAPLMTPQKDFRPMIVELLKETGGGRRMQEVLDEIEERMGSRFQPHDWEPVTTGEIRWRNSARWERMKMADEGLIKKGTAAGWWELTDEGGSA